MEMLVILFILINMSCSNDSLLLEEEDYSTIIEIPREPTMAYIEDNKDIITGCHSEFPTLSVGDYFFNSPTPDFERFKKKNKVFILGISDST